MTEVINAQFRAGGKEYSFNPNGLSIQVGQGVIVSTPKGPEYAVCTAANHEVDETSLISPLRPVVRLATGEDEAAHKAPSPVSPDREKTPAERERERQAMRLCREKVEQYGLDMALVRAEVSPDGSKILIYFTAENRVDFRALVKDLAAGLHARIELRQIGVRDETKMLGGIGICGQVYCCSRYLDKFQPVSIKMAKTQNLSLNPTKISGACGRLMCCLKYEQGAYEDAVKRCPKKESFVETPDGVGTVTEVNYLREKVKVRIEGGDEQPKQYYNQEIRVVRSGKGKRPEDYVMPSKAELEALRYIPPQEERKLSDEPRGGLAEKLEELLASEAKRTPIRKSGHSGGGRSRRGGGQGQGKPKPKSAGGEPKAAGQSQGGGGGKPKSQGGSHHHRRRRPQGQGPKSEG